MTIAGALLWPVEPVVATPMVMDPTALVEENELSNPPALPPDCSGKPDTVELIRKRAVAPMIHLPGGYSRVC